MQHRAIDKCDISLVWPDDPFSSVLRKTDSTTTTSDLQIVNMSTMANPNVTIHAGGPIQTNQMMLLHDSDTIPNQTLKVTDGIYLGGDLAFLQEALVDREGPHLLLCFGYTGWGPGQLEREFLDGSWFVWPAKAQHIFGIPSDKLWAQLLREMGGRYAPLSMIPEDLTLN